MELAISTVLSCSLHNQYIKYFFPENNKHQITGVLSSVIELVFYHTVPNSWVFFLLSFLDLSVCGASISQLCLGLS